MLYREENLPFKTYLFAYHRQEYPWNFPRTEGATHLFEKLCWLKELKIIRGSAITFVRYVDGSQVSPFILHVNYLSHRDNTMKIMSHVNCCAYFPLCFVHFFSSSTSVSELYLWQVTFETGFICTLGDDAFAGEMTKVLRVLETEYVEVRVNTGQYYLTLPKTVKKYLWNKYWKSDNFNCRQQEWR